MPRSVCRIIYFYHFWIRQDLTPGSAPRQGASTVGPMDSSSTVRRREIEIGLSTTFGGTLPDRVDEDAVLRQGAST
jgi:hypothetical protein